MSSDYPPPGPGQDPEGQSNPPPPPPPPPSEPQWNPQSGGTPPPGAGGAPGYGQPGYGDPAYGQPPPYGQPPGYPPQQPGAPGGYGAPQQTSPLAIVSLVLGILGVPCCTFFVLGIAAIVTGFLARKQIAESQGRLKGSGMAVAGLILGIVMTVIAVVYWILILAGAINDNFYA
jgi:hypothetical protein